MKSSAFFSVGFRPFFASGIFFGALAILIWAGFWVPQLQLSFDQVMNPVGGFYFWHPHELIMGFSQAIIIGFLLTAARNWTGLETTTPLTLGIIWLTWLWARFVMAFGEGYSINLIVLSQILPPLLAAASIASPIIRKRMWRNLFAPITLLMLALFDMALLHQQHESHTQPSQLFYAVMYMLMFLVAMIAGRIIPFFTANKLGIEKWIEPKLLLLTSVVPLLLLMPIQAISDHMVRSYLTSGLAAVLLISHGIRLYKWHHKHIWQHPMLWSLWVSYASMLIGFILLCVQPIFNFGSVALHIFALGSISGLIVSMVSRVSLGHTGRTIVHDRVIIAAILCMLIAALIRTLAIAVFGFSVGLIITSALFASISLALLFARFVVIWITPRSN